ncbi:hypothetical protein GDO81_003085 [Engystomops pustulosus]|uniref:Ig-like domain-containing protein n=1 Tax=Engystomops pustulosus TaxID=76066 RepID=A0AAV6ZXU4_ENGPU|nr:hypothetical protein GDO81_003085 [Engystomops pustulosus]
MKLQLSRVSLAFLLIISFPHYGNGQKQLVVTQPKMLQATAGASVNISCSFISSDSSYTATWTLGCEATAIPLKDHLCFQHRVKFSVPASDQTASNSQAPSDETQKATITIFNLTENDSGSFCCHIKTVLQKEMGSGTGTILEVTRKSIAAVPSDDLKMSEKVKTYILYGVIGAETCVIIILLAVVIKHRLQGSSSAVDQDVQMDPSGLQYAEICKKSFPKQSRQQRKVESITYSAVKVKNQPHLTKDEYELH